VISPSQGRYLTQTQNKHKQTSMTRVGYEPMIQAFERAKTVHALDRAVTVIDKNEILTLPYTTWPILLATTSILFFVQLLPLPCMYIYKGFQHIASLPQGINPEDCN
jgi:hypothetical protein